MMRYGFIIINIKNTICETLVSVSGLEDENKKALRLKPKVDESNSLGTCVLTLTAHYGVQSEKKTPRQIEDTDR